MNDVILDQCLADLCAHRATLAECLAKYPDQIDVLQPLLELALALEATPDVQPSPAFKQTTRARLARLQPPARAARALPFGGGLRFATAAVVIVLLFAALAVGTAYAAGDSLPGNTLYPVKRAMEQVELGLAGSAESRARVHLSLADRRLSEVVALSKTGQSQLAEQAVSQYSSEVNAVVTLWQPLPSQPAAPTTELIVRALVRQQGELRAIQAPASPQKTIQNALDASQKALEHFAPAPAPTTLPAAPKPTSAPAPVLPTATSPKATETPRPLPPPTFPNLQPPTNLLKLPTLPIPMPRYPSRCRQARTRCRRQQFHCRRRRSDCRDSLFLRRTPMHCKASAFCFVPKSSLSLTRTGLVGILGYELPRP